jgi:hypothetical protein
MPLGHAVDNIGKVGFWIESVEFCAFENRIEHRGTVSSCVGPEEQKVFSRNGDTAQGTLGGSVANFR